MYFFANQITSLIEGKYILLKYLLQKSFSQNIRISIFIFVYYITGQAKHYKQNLANS